LAKPYQNAIASAAHATADQKNSLGRGKKETNIWGSSLGCRMRRFEHRQCRGLANHSCLKITANSSCAAKAPVGKLDLAAPRLSSSAKADDLVLRDAGDETEKPRRTGYPGFAGQHDFFA